MTGRIRQAAVHTIINSGGGPAVEAEVRLADGYVGHGSTPVAIKPGKREIRRSTGLRVGAPVPEQISQEVARLAGSEVADQTSVDAWLSKHMDALGSDVMLAVSLAYARAAASSAGISLTRHIAMLAGTQPAFPGLLVAAVSGGIHGGAGLPFQQLMLATECGSPTRVVPQVMDVYRQIEQALFRAGHAVGYSASSGIVVGEAGAAVALDLIKQAITDLGMADDVGIAIDVAAEHLYHDGAYRIEGQSINADRLAQQITYLADRYPVVMVEDPFVAAHRQAWEQLTGTLRGRATVVGDDLFASSARYLDPTLAGGVLLKMNQVGTLSDTIRTALRARETGMVCAVSHRSLETEDTAVCDLAVALGARWIKVGGPRRGDRVAKYNQLLRLGRGAATDL